MFILNKVIFKLLKHMLKKIDLKQKNYLVIRTFL